MPADREWFAGSRTGAPNIRRDSRPRNAEIETVNALCARSCSAGGRHAPCTVRQTVITREAPVKRRKKTDEEHAEEQREAEKKKASRSAPNPPRTTTNGLTAPKFGSAGSGGLELEPGPERD